ncbi:MAG: hypothetical protein ACI9DH_000079 [Halioglobus sp.]|jgi:hypothetical protein
MDENYRNQLRADAETGNKVAERLLISGLLAESEHEEIAAELDRLEQRSGAVERGFVEAELNCFHAWPCNEPWQDVLRECCDAGHAEARFVSALYHDWAQCGGKLTQTADDNSQQWTQGWSEWNEPTWTTVIDREGVRVERSDDFAPQALVGALRSILGSRLQPSSVIDPDSGIAIAHPVRINRSSQWLPEQLGWVGKLFECRLAQAGGYQVPHGEVLNLLHYQPGQHYKPHLDCMSSEQAESPGGQAQGGQRMMTILMGMGSADFTGGETYFPKLELGVKLAAGELLRFNNANTEGHPLQFAVHEGKPLESGEKWLLSKWVRQLPTPYGREVVIVSPNNH